MKLTRMEIKDIVIQCLREISGEAEIDEETNPIKDLGFDTYSGIEIACSLSEKLDYDIPHHINPLVDDEQNRARKVKDIIDLMCELLPERKDLEHA